MSDEKVLPFMEHLIELRKRLIVCVVALVIGMGVCWNYSTNLMDLVERPLTGKTYLTDLKKQIYGEVKVRFPAMYQHYKLAEELSTPQTVRKLNYSAPLEPFFVQCKLSMLAGFVLVLPVIFHQLWLFIAPGLTRKERRLVVPFVSASSFAFLVGGGFFLVVIWPVIINFSLSYEAVGLQSWFNLSAYINFCLRLILVFGLIFELPILSFLLSRFGLVNYRMLAEKRKYALLASSIIAAFHADLITMFVIMIPLYLMYEVSIWVALLFGKKRQPAMVEE